MPKVSIIGAGNVGATAAIHLMKKQIADVVLVDNVPKLAEGKATDIKDSLALEKGNCKIAGTEDISCIAESDIIVITAGKPRLPGMNNREQLLEENSKIVKEVASQIKIHSPNSIVMTVTNPVDKMNTIVMNELQADRKKIIGIGGMLDSIRLRTIIAHELDVPVSKVSAMMIGPHNDSMILLLSQATVNKKSIHKVVPAEKISEIVSRVKKRGAEIIERTGTSPYYAVGNVIANMVEHVLLDKKELISASVHLIGEYGITGVSIGVPIKLGREGAEIVEMEIAEKEELRKIAETMK